MIVLRPAAMVASRVSLFPTGYAKAGGGMDAW